MFSYPNKLWEGKTCNLCLKSKNFSLRLQKVKTKTSVSINVTRVEFEKRHTHTILIWFPTNWIIKNHLKGLGLGALDRWDHYMCQLCNDLNGSSTLEHRTQAAPHLKSPRSLHGGPWLQPVTIRKRTTHPWWSIQTNQHLPHMLIKSKSCSCISVIIVCFFYEKNHGSNYDIFHCYNYRLINNWYIYIAIIIF